MRSTLASVDSPIAEEAVSLEEALDGSGRTTTVDSLLGLLSLRPMSGYELRQMIAESIGNFWSESFGQIYPALRSMVTDGLVDVAEQGPSGHPARKVYQLTNAGWERLRRWLGTPARTQVPRNDLLLKLFFSAGQGPGTALVHLRRFVVEQQTKEALFKAILHQLETGPRRALAGFPYWRLTVRYGLRQAQALLCWAEDAIAEMEELARTGVSGK